MALYALCAVGGFLAGLLFCIRLIIRSAYKPEERGAVWRLFWREAIPGWKLFDSED
jgi:hypothetical protein